MDLDLNSVRALVATISNGLASTRAAHPLPLTSRVAIVLDHLPDEAVQLTGDAGHMLLSAVLSVYPQRAQGQRWRSTDSATLTLDRVAELGQALADTFATTPETATLQERVTTALELLSPQMIGELGDAASDLIGLAMARLQGGGVRARTPTG